MRCPQIAARLMTTLLLISGIAFAQSTGEIDGIAWSADGKPLAGVQVVVHRADQSSHETVTSGSDGTFTVPNLKPGRYWIAGYSEKAQLISESSLKVDVVAGQTLHADVTLGKDTTSRTTFQRLVRRIDGLH
jgi:hypothetical protein